jgi:ABC-type branched-subunit amino acid transport system ATPase component
MTEKNGHNGKNHNRPLLEGKSVSKFFGGLAAVHEVDFAVYPGEIVGLVGPNGSGKTTLFDCLTRIQAVDHGQIFFKGVDITHKKPHQVAHLGLSRTFQVIRVYRKMTVLENLLISRQWHGETLWKMLWPSQKETEKRAVELIHFLQIDHLIHEKAGHLSGGQQRLLELGMALMPDPDLILLDEATSGVNPTLIETIKDRIRALHQNQGKSFLMVEHNIEFISDMCSRVYVLNYGQKLAEGAPEEIKNNEEVIAAYFGT